MHTYDNILQPTTTYYNMLQHPFNILQHTTTYYNILQRTYIQPLISKMSCCVSCDVRLQPNMTRQRKVEAETRWRQQFWKCDATVKSTVKIGIQLGNRLGFWVPPKDHFHGEQDFSAIGKIGGIPVSDTQKIIKSDQAIKRTHLQTQRNSLFKHQEYIWTI